MRTLTLVVEDYNKDPCVRLFFAGCFLLLPREKEEPDTQAKSIAASLVASAHIFPRSALVTCYCFVF